MRRFFLNEPLSSLIEIKDEDAKHIMRVLRMKIGDNIVVVGQDGQTGMAEIQTLSANTVSAVLKTIIQEDQEPPVDVCLAQALPKGDKMDYIVQKSVELGVTQIIPMITEHCVVKYDEHKKAERCCRWQKIAAEAAKQCGRTFIPNIGPVQRLLDIVQNHETATLVIMLYEGQNVEPIKNLFIKNKSIRKFVLLIGPEGGFSKNEVDLCHTNGIATVSMGPRILRTETASLAALAAIMYEYGDLGG